MSLLKEAVQHGGARVFRSSNNMLYLTGGSNGAAALYTDAGFGKSIDKAAWETTFAGRKAAAEQAGSRFAQLIVPEKLTVYPLARDDRAVVFPGLAEQDIVSPGRRLVRDIGKRDIFYPDQFLREQATRMPIFPETDSHWTWRGAFSAFQILVSCLGYAPDYARFINLPKTRLRYRGDLWESSFADVEPSCFERVVLPPAIRRIYANPIIGTKEKMGLEDEQGLHMGSHAIFHNPDAQFKETVVLFGSSFSECRLEPSLLTSIFAFYFEFVHFVWATSVDAGYIARHRPNLTIAEMPERFLTLMPADNTCVEDAATDKLRKWKQKADLAPPRKPVPPPLWADQRTRICAGIAAHAAPFKILLKTKNEPERVKSWIAHHAAIVGVENLIIFDNMSDDQAVLDIYAGLDGKMPIIRFNQFHNMVHHTVYYSELYAALRQSCDYFIFLDTDEYLALYDGQDHFQTDGRIVDFLRRRAPREVFPATWLSNLRGHGDRFVLPRSREYLIDGLKWGKPIIPTDSNFAENINHNTQLDHGLYGERLTTDFFVLHRHSVAASDRIHANLLKLVSYKTLKPGQGVADVLALDIENLTPPNAQKYCREIRNLVSAGAETLPSMENSFEILQDGLINWNAAWQREEMQRFVAHPEFYTAGLFSASS